MTPTPQAVLESMAKAYGFTRNDGNYVWTKAREKQDTRCMQAALDAAQREHGLELVNAAKIRDEWQDASTLPDMDNRPGRLWIAVEGFSRHSGITWIRQYATIVHTSKETMLGIRQKDAQRILEDGGMDCIERITHWMPVNVLFPVYKCNICGAEHDGRFPHKPEAGSWIRGGKHAVERKGPENALGEKTITKIIAPCEKEEEE